MTDRAFRAIGDPTRRRILDLVRAEGPKRAGDIAERFPRVTRQAVSKHLGILRRARLLEDSHDGRERWYALNADPLREIYMDWLRHYEGYWRDRLHALKRVTEADEARRRR